MERTRPELGGVGTNPGHSLGRNEGHHKPRDLAEAVRGRGRSMCQARASPSGKPAAATGTTESSIRVELRATNASEHGVCIPRMTTPITTHHGILATMAFLGLSASAHTALTAQEPSPPHTRPAATRPAAPPAVAEEEVEEVDDDEVCIVSLEFPGGKLSDFITTLRRVLRETESKRFHNLLATGPTSRISLPAIDVYQVEIGSLFEAVATMVQPQHVLDFRMIHNGEGHPVMMLSTFPDQSNDLDPDDGSKVAVEAFALRGLTTVLPTEPANFALSTATVLTAIETALELTPGEGDPATLRFHEDSGLLLVQGTARQLDTVRRILDTLSVDIDRLRSRHRASQPSLMDRRPTPQLDDVTMPQSAPDKQKNPGR